MVVYIFIVTIIIFFASQCTVLCEILSPPPSSPKTLSELFSHQPDLVKSELDYMWMTVLSAIDMYVEDKTANQTSIKSVREQHFQKRMDQDIDGLKFFVVGGNITEAVRLENELVHAVNQHYEVLRHLAIFSSVPFIRHLPAIEESTKLTSGVNSIIESAVLSLLSEDHSEISNYAAPVLVIGGLDLVDTAFVTDEMAKNLRSLFAAADREDFSRSVVVVLVAGGQSLTGEKKALVDQLYMDEFLSGSSHSKAWASAQNAVASQRFRGALFQKQDILNNFHKVIPLAGRSTKLNAMRAAYQFEEFRNEMNLLSSPHDDNDKVKMMLYDVFISGKTYQ